jgi:hypothetical protein
MKTQDIQIGISSRRRRNGEGPGIGSVTRVRRSAAEIRADGRRKRGGRMNSQRKTSLLMVSLLIGTLTCGILGSAVVFWLRPLLVRSTVQPLVWEEARVRVVSQFTSPTEDEAMQLVKRALATRQEENVEALFRLGSSSPSEVIAFLAKYEKIHGSPTRFDWMSSIDAGGLLLEGVLVRYPGSGSPVERLAYLTPDANGTWKLDFESYARVVKPSWEEILSSRAAQAHVRVFLKAGRLGWFNGSFGESGPFRGELSDDVYFNGPFSDDKEWVYYKLTSPDMDEVLHGYCKAGSAEAEAVEKLFSEGNRTARASLEIRRVENGEKRQFQITRLLASDWVLP